MRIKAEKVYLCCGNKTGVAHPEEWLGIDKEEPCDLKMDVRDIESVKARVVFATPPCASFTDLPWRRATNKDADILIHCRNLCEQAPLRLLENNRWAQKIIGTADFHRNSHYFWGNLMVGEFDHYKGATSGHNRSERLKRAAMPPVVFI